MEQAATDNIALQILTRLQAPEPDHARFSGTPLDTTALDAQQLGQLWPTLKRLCNATAKSLARETALTVLLDAEKRNLSPVLDLAMCTATLADLAEGDLAEAVATLSYTPNIADADDAIRAQVVRVLGPANEWESTPFFDVYKVYPLARIAGSESLAELRLGLQTLRALALATP
ncbi:hypothetical protein [Massilia sp. TSP1-1-2]|uniref:hypothetical protein n=1 Tax=Massilia sp. TSP1-1-2 TaxID=2804649 RepID=UPI003CF37455